MITNGKIAEQVRDAMLNVNERLENSLKQVEQKCPPGEHAQYKKAIGKIVSCIVFDILEPLYKQNPALKPPGWDD